MKYLRTLSAATQTLRHSFLARRQTSRAAFSSCRIQNQYRSPLQSEFPPRSLHQTQGYENSASAEEGEDNNDEAPQAFYQDEKIPSQWVYIPNAEGKLAAPIRLCDALKLFERPKFFLQQVSRVGPNEPPVCRIMSRQQVKEYEKARSKAAHAAKTAVKQMELNWAIDRNDLSGRMNQLGKFLSKGKKVDIVLTKKQGKRQPTVEEVKNVMSCVVSTVKAADAAPIKPMEGEPGKQVTLTVRKKEFL